MHRGVDALKRTRVLGLVLTLAFLGLAFYRVDFGELAVALTRVNYLLVLLAAVVTLTGYVVRTLRWRVILTRTYAPAFVTLFGILMVGFATNNLLPARLGELARAYLLGRRNGQRKTLALATILLERVFDGLVLIGFLLAFSAMAVVALPLWGQEVLRLASVVFLLAGLGVTVVLTRRELTARLLGMAVRPLPNVLSEWVEAAFTAFADGLASLRRGEILLATGLLSIGIWSIEALSYFILIHAFGLPLQGIQSVAAALLVLVIVNLGIMIPSAPGYVGTFQFFAVSALSVLQVAREPALAYAIVAHLMQYFLVTGIGLGFMARMNLSLGRITEAPPPSSPITAGERV